MTTGSTTTFEESRDQIITDALAKLGVIGPDGTPSGRWLTHAARALNRVVKSIDPEGVHLWRVIERTSTTTSGTGTFAPAADVLSIDEPMNYMRSGTTVRSPIREISRDDWMNIGDRTVTGLPSQFYVSQVLGALTVHLYPVPDATSDTVTYSAVLKSLDFSTGANTPDFPAHWSTCLIYGLAADLAFDAGQPEMVAALRPLFDGEKARLLESGTENGNVTLSPFGAYSGGW